MKANIDKIKITKTVAAIPAGNLGQGFSYTRTPAQYSVSFNDEILGTISGECLGYMAQTAWTCHAVDGRPVAMAYTFKECKGSARLYFATKLVIAALNTGRVEAC